MSSAISHPSSAVMFCDYAAMSDGQVLERFVSERDEEAFAILVKRHGPMVLGVCRRILNNGHDAEDAFQAAFLVLARKGSSIVPRQMVGNWLYGVAYRTATKAKSLAGIRRARERQVWALRNEISPNDSMSAEVQLLLDQELARLPDAYRAAIVSCDLQGRTRAETARELGLPEGTISSRLARGRTMLAERLASRGVVVSVGVLALILSAQSAAVAVPASLATSTMKAISTIAAEKTLSATALSTGAFGLAQSVLKAMLIKKLKIGIAILMMVLVLATATSAMRNNSHSPPLLEQQQQQAIERRFTSSPQYLSTPPNAFGISEEAMFANAAEETPAFEAYTETIPRRPEKFDMVPIKGGKFLMAPIEKGGQPREVEVKSFWMGKTEITWEVYDIFAVGLDQTEAEKKKDDALVDKAARARPSHPYGAPDYNFGHAGYPALCMTYKSADRFCQWLSQKTGRKYRLPTEAEFEYAARAGASLEPINIEALKKMAWFKENSEESTHPVGKLVPNAWGLYDMLGNTAEWCTGMDGKPVTRGGSWRTRTRLMTYALRELQQEDWNIDPQDPKSTWWLSGGKFVGFRVVRDAE